MNKIIVCLLLTVAVLFTVNLVGSIYNFYTMPIACVDTTIIIINTTTKNINEHASYGSSWEFDWSVCQYCPVEFIAPEDRSTGCDYYMGSITYNDNGDVILEGVCAE